MRNRSDAADVAARGPMVRRSVSRRHLIKVVGVAAALGALGCQGESAPLRASASAQETALWDKTFPMSALVNHEKVWFKNRLGIDIAADLYVHKNLDRTKAFDDLKWISPRPVLFVTGDQAHSRIFSEHAFERASEPKELYIVPGAGHVDLYDRVDLIPWDKLTSYFHEHLTGQTRS